VGVLPHRNRQRRRHAYDLDAGDRLHPLLRRKGATAVAAAAEADDERDEGARMQPGHAPILSWIAAPRLSARAAVRARPSAVEAVGLVPGLDRQLGIAREPGPATTDLHPGRLEAQHQVDMRRRHGQRRVDGARVGPHAVRPLWVEHIDVGPALAAEPALGGADFGAATLANASVIFFQKAAPPHAQRVAPAHYVAAKRTAGGLATDRAVAIHEWVRCVRLHTKGHATALAGALEQHA